jgi:alcohol dehydrogenase, propanol-preferring
MRAAVCTEPGSGRLDLQDLPAPRPGPHDLLLRVRACGVCRTDLHLVDGELADPKVPVVPGHEVVGEVAELGAAATGFSIGDRVGVPWLGSTCGECAFCLAGRENLCARARFTGCHRDGGFAEMCAADARFCLPLPTTCGDTDAAPLLCAGLIGYRALSMCGDAAAIGLYGFGAAAHLLAQTAMATGRTVFAFTRPGDEAGQQFARGLGCLWAGSSAQLPPMPLDAAILFAPVGALVPLALAAVRPGGTVVCAGIHMSDIPSFPYRLLWQERTLRSVANLTRRDGRDYFAAIARHPVRAHARRYALAQANAALADLRAGRIEGAAVLVP